MKTKLTIKNIYDKTFKSKMRGFDPVEVDEFLDMIMQDYEAFENEIARLNEQLKTLSTVGDTNRTIVDKPAPRVESAGSTNYDILRRISNLEKHVFGSKIDVD
ncbi:cell division regulator GpsB [Carnobacteriaceae bacterium zg-ZUI252]|nr:cell division regulator GpsB [Carnobacteriaceae bacterium zg-ZUI252]QTU82381.1 cell division regulator GpsB [Carnobacteriaceae bacterium zg-C25]